MPANNSIVAIYKTHLDAESAIKELQKSGFDMKKLSIVAKDFETSENVVGYYKRAIAWLPGGSWAHSGDGSGACYSAQLFLLFLASGLLS